MLLPDMNWNAPMVEGVVRVSVPELIIIRPVFERFVTVNAPLSVMLFAA